jgi:hypothetical protein
MKDFKYQLVELDPNKRYAIIFHKELHPDHLRKIKQMLDDEKIRGLILNDAELLELKDTEPEKLGPPAPSIETIRHG